MILFIEHWHISIINSYQNYVQFKTENKTSNYEILDALRREKVTKYWISYSTIQIMFNYFVTLTSMEESEIDKKITKKKSEIKNKN